MRKKALAIEIIVVCVVVLALLVLIFFKLSSSKNEAEMSKSIRNLATLINDIDTYYSTNNEFIDIALMTKVGLDKNKWFFVKSEQCLQFSTFKEYIVIKKTENPGELCKSLLKYDSVKSLLVGKESPNDEALNTNMNISSIIYIKAGNKYNSSIL